MAIQRNIVLADHWFIGTDKTLRFEIFTAAGESGGVMLDVSGFSFLFRLTQTLIGQDPLLNPGALVFEKQSPDITVTGVFNSVRATNTQRVEVPVLAADTAALLKGGTFAYALERIDAGVEDVFSFGTAQLRKPATR